MYADAQYEEVAGSTYLSSQWSKLKYSLQSAQIIGYIKLFNQFLN